MTNEHRKYDSATPVSHLFEKFVRNSQDVYFIGSRACVDTMLVSFSGHCRFKVLFHTDAENYYLHYGNIYIGKDSDGKNR
jgi:hypothetical protein